MVRTDKNFLAVSFQQDLTSTSTTPNIQLEEIAKLIEKASKRKKAA